MRAILLATLMLSSGSAWAQGKISGEPLTRGNHCVAYRTTKTLALVSSDEVVGRNCSVTTKAMKDSAGMLSVEVGIPISGFNSKEPDRDKEVSKWLMADKQPVMVFRTQNLSRAQWESMLQKGSGLIRGTLKIGGKNYPLNSTAKVRRNGNQIEVYGAIYTKFTAFGIKPPEVGPGGVIAKAPDYLELHYNLLSSKVQNLSGIL